ncbi:MAG: hypothetical protein M2R45_02464 [Verrucomicrobia subdivision 3 bacterium]|nr:hypothetical protein [Limisphaerales bacterium]MCS1413252.1 hypothetical protein [Limisphaerales bacterium]
MYRGLPLVRDIDRGDELHTQAVNVCHESFEAFSGNEVYGVTGSAVIDLPQPMAR